jgi:putative holliday junction resolvase
MKYLGIDYGTKRTGVALSDEGGKVAFPHSVIGTTKNLSHDVVALAQKEGVEKFVIGKSIDGSGKENAVMGRVHELVEALRQHGEVAFEDERYSSQHALRGHDENDMHDASTAAIILQSYLDRKNRTSVANDPYTLPE